MNESKPPQLRSRLSLELIRELADEQDRDHVEIISRQERTAKAEKAIDRDLRDEVRADRARQIRKTELGHVEELVAAMKDRAEQAESQLRHWTPEAAHRRAVFSGQPAEDAAIRMAWMGRLQKSPSPELLEVARDAAADRSLALAVTVLLEAQSRKDLPHEIAQEITGLVASIPTPEIEEPTAMLRRVAALHQDAFRVQEDLRTGRTDLTRKLAAARKLASPPERPDPRSDRLTGRAASA